MGYFRHLRKLDRVLYRVMEEIRPPIFDWLGNLTICRLTNKECAEKVRPVVLYTGETKELCGLYDTGNMRV